MGGVHRVRFGLGVRMEGRTLMMLQLIRYMHMAFAFL